MSAEEQRDQAGPSNEDDALTKLPVVSLKLTCYMDPSRNNQPPFQFDPIDRDLFDGITIKIGRQVNKNNGPNPQNSVSANKDCIWFKSKVVSRSHAEIWVRDGQVYLKDTASSSGTFLNSVRLSSTNRESRPYPLKDGDVIQLGVDYQGRPEDIYKAVYMKVQVTSRTVVQQKLRANTAMFRAALRALLNATNPYASSRIAPVEQNGNPMECCICISPICPFQALFVAPCSHCFHYKCISPILQQGLMFQCPLCRQVANLAAPVATDDDQEIDEALERDLMAQMGLADQRQPQNANTFVEPPRPENQGTLNLAQEPTSPDRMSINQVVAPPSPRSREGVNSSPETDGDEMEVSDEDSNGAEGGATDMGEERLAGDKRRDVPDDDAGVSA